MFHYGDDSGEDVSSEVHQVDQCACVCSHLDDSAFVLLDTVDEVSSGDSDWVQADEKSFWKPGDKLEFYAEYYTYAGVFEGTHVIGEITVSEDMEFGDLELAEGNYRHSYRFTDLYQQSYWTPAYMQTVE